MFDDLTQKINKLDGIISCKITGEDEIDEVHIIADKKRNPKRIVRDVETIILVNEDKDIDHKKISIAQFEHNSKDNDIERLEIISIFKENNNPVCHYRLRINDNIFEGKSSDNPDEPIIYKTAKGLIEILEKYLQLPGRLRIENIFKTGIKDEIVVVQICLYNEHGSKERLLGSTYINQDLPLAVGKACLKALNRKIIGNY
ncbi:MAG: hypothetical protein ACQEQH_01595 [Bacillota bacterium]